MEKIIHVLGTGATLKNYVPDNNDAVGVNDIFKYHPVKYLVCVDLPKRFDKKRMDIIADSWCYLFYTQYKNEWAPYFIRNLVPLCLAPFRGNIDTLDNKDAMPFSNNSAFVAVVVAYHLKATKIILHGVAFTDHKNLSQPIIQKRAISDFKKLFHALHRRGVTMRVSSKESLLSTIMPVL